jgi:hypothetical protein
MIFKSSIGWVEILEIFMGLLLLVLCGATGCTVREFMKWI